MKYLRRQNFNPGNILDDTVVQTADGSVEINPTSGRVTINADLVIAGAVPGTEVTNVMYVTVDGDDKNTGLGEGPNQAKRTIKSAVAAAQEGTTIFVRSGEYYEDNPIRLPPKVSIIGDNLRRTILRPLNKPKKFTANLVSRNDGIVTVSTNETHELKLHDRVRVIIPEAGIDVECANITEILNSNQFSYKDYGTNLASTVTTQGTVELGIDFFLVSSQSYIAQLVFKGFQAPGYCLNIDKDAIVDTSPYIQNCSNINGPWLRNGTEWLPFITEQPDLTGAMVKGPRPLRDDEIDPLQVDQYGVNERGAGGGMLIDGDRYNSESPIKSMVADAFTQIAQGAVGFHITNFGYMQLVSCFAVFCDKAFYTTNGGYLSISNSVIDFGNKGFVADGYYPTPYSTGIVNDAYYSSVGSITVNSEGVGYTSAPNVTIQAPSLLVPGSTQSVATANIDSIRGTVNAITVDDPGSGYDFQPTVTIEPPFTPYQEWQPNTFYGIGAYLLFEFREYQVTGAGTTSAEGPTHTSGAVLNGTATLTLVGAQARATVNLSKNLTVTVNGLSEKPQVASIMFIGDDPIGYYIEDTSNQNLNFRYNEQKCRRDVGYIVDAVLSDLIFGTNFRTIYAGRSYLRSYSSKVLSSQRAQTVNGINQARLQVKGYVTPSNPALEAQIDALFDIVTNIVQTGDVGASIPNYTNLVGRPAGFIEARDILLANKQFFQDQIVDYIANELQGFQYDEAKCSRDVGIIVNAVLDDLVLGTNYLSKTAALSYLRSYSEEVLINQLTPTVKGIERARDIVLKTLQDEYNSEIKVRSLFDIVTDILRERNVSVAPATFYTDPINILAGVINSARTIETNKQSIISSVVNYINANLDPLNIERYNENLCKRDTGYIVEALVYDVLYGGNSATHALANSFFDADGNLVVSTQVTEHVAAFNQLKTIIAGLAPTTATTTNSLIDIVIVAISLGQSFITVKTNPTYVNGSLYQYYNDEKTRVVNDIVAIQNEVINYLNTEFGANFSYNEATCRRDIGYIVDALAYDLTYGGNTQITNAALAYSEGSVIAGEVEETKRAYQYWKSILPYVLQNQAVPDAIVGGQVTNLPLGNPVPVEYPSTNAQNLIQIVIDVIDYGPGYVPEPVTESDFSLGNAGLVLFKNTVLDNLLSVQNNVINYLNSTYGGDVDVTVFPGILDIPPGSEVRFHNVSTISTGGTALEYVGAGVTYNSLPFFGGEPDPEQERTEINNGKCFTVTNDQVGNFRVGTLFQVNALTGGVTIDANNLSLGGIESIGPFRRNGIPVGVELKEVSNNPALISSIGTQDTNTVPTQQAVSTYVENRYLNKVQDTTPQTVESDVAFQQDVAVNGGDLTSTANTFNLLNQSTTVNAFNAAANITVGATSGTLTVRNTQTRFTSTDSVKLPVGTTLQRDSTPEVGQIRYNTTTTSFEGFGPGNAWGSLGGVIDVDRNTYIIPETAPGANENILYFYNNGVLTATLEQTSFNTSNGVIVNINDVTGSDSTLNGALVVDGGVGIAQNVNIGGTLTVAGNSALNGANLTTTQTSFNLLNTTASTVNAFGAATTLVLASTAGTTNIRNDLDVDGDIHLDGGDLTASTSTFNLLNTVVNNLNFANAADTIVIGGTSGSLTLRNASNIMLGNLEVRGGNVTTNQTTFNLLNTIATTVNAFGATSSLTLGATTGTTTIRNANTVVTGDLAVNGGDITTTATTFNFVANNATTVNSFGAATTLNLGLSATDFNIGATSGTLTVRNTQTVFNSTNSIRLPVGTIAQRPGVPVDGLVRYNSELQIFEGYGPGSSWGSLGGVRDVDGNTYIIAELTPAANDNTLWFYNNGVQTLTITESEFDLQSPVRMVINNTTESLSATTGALTVAGGVGIAGNLFIGGATQLAADLVLDGDLAVNGGDITSTSSSFRLVNQPTTVDAFTSADNITIGSTVGTLTLRNPTVIGTSTSQNLYNTVATTLNIGGAATLVDIGANTGTTSVNNNLVVDLDLTVLGGDIISTTSSFNLLNTTVSTVNAFGDATAVNIGAASGTTNVKNNLDVDGNVNIDGGSLTVSTATFNIATTTASTINLGTSALTVEIGAASGTTNVNNNLVVDLDLAVNGGDITTNQATFNLVNTAATTVNFAGAATTVEIGAATGTTRIKHNLDVDGNIEVGGSIIPTTDQLQDLGSPTNRFRDLYVSGASIYLGDVVLTAAGILQLDSSLELGGDSFTTTVTTFNLLDDTATTVNAFGAATVIDIGAATGTLTINNNQVIFNSVDSIRIPVGTTLQRDVTPEIGQIRYNTTLSSFEGFGPGNQWGSLGGVKDVDGNTYIIAELTPAANDNTLWFYNNGVQTLTITESEFDLKSPVRMTINNTTNSTSSTTGALVVDGGIGVANDIVGAGWLTSSIQQFEIDEGEY